MAETTQLTLFQARIYQLIDHLCSTMLEQPVLESFIRTANNVWILWGLQALCTVAVLYICGKTCSKAVLNNCVSDQWDWSREVVLITGGCSGIGEQIARKLAEHRVRVVVLDVISPKPAMPAYVHFYKCDITSTEAIHSTAHHIREHIGNPTILINNAGVATSKDLLNETDEEIERTFQVNSLAHFWVVREFLPEIIQHNHGHIITVASIASFVTVASNISYSCTKAAALSFHEGLAQELRHRYQASKVRTSVIHPTWTRTPLIENLVAGSRWNSWTIEAHTVAEAVVSHIFRGESGQVFIPGSYALASLVKGLPTWLQESIRNSQSEVLRAGH